MPLLTTRNYGVEFLLCSDIQRTSCDRTTTHWFLSLFYLTVAQNTINSSSQHIQQNGTRRVSTLVPLRFLIDSLQKLHPSLRLPKQMLTSSLTSRMYKRPNNVPYYQRLFFEAEKKHVRQWNVVRTSIPSHAKPTPSPCDHRAISDTIVNPRCDRAIEANSCCIHTTLCYSAVLSVSMEEPPFPYHPGGTKRSNNV